MNRIFRDLNTIALGGAPLENKSNSKVPSAEEFMNNMPSSMKPSEAMREFANLHREAILKAAASSACIDFQKRTRTYGEISKSFRVNGGDFYKVDKESILNCYPKELIK